MPETMTVDLVHYGRAGEPQLRVQDGEVVDLRSLPTDELTEIRQNIVEELRVAQKAIDAVLIERLDDANRKSLRMDRYTIAVTDSEGIEWDGEKLYRTLTDLALKGLLDGHAVSEAVRTETVYKVDARAAKRLIMHVKPEIRDAVAECWRKVAKNRYVKVTRAGTRS